MQSEHPAPSFSKPDKKTTAQTNRRGGVSIGTILVLLMAAVIVPAIIFAIVLLQRNNQAQQQMVTTLAEATAGSISEAVDRQLAGMLTTLRVLSTSAAITAGNFADFYRRANEALGETNAFFIVADENLNQLLNTSVPYGTPLSSLDDVETAKRAMSTGQPAVSDAFFGQTTNEWVFNVALPVSDKGIARLLALRLKADTLSESLSSQHLRGGWNAVVVDREGIVLASSHMSSDVGKRFFLLEDGRPDTGAVRLTTIHNGHEYEEIHATSALSGWETIVWAPAEVVHAPLRRSMHLLALGGLAIITVGATLAWILGGQIARPIRALARDARRLGAGEDVVPVDFAVAEIATVSHALAQASRDRQAAENEIRFLMREVAHRSKNQLTVVSSIAKQTARHARTFAAFEDAFQKRVLGLARSTDLLIAGGVSGVELRALVETQIEPFAPSGAERKTIDGDPFRLSNAAAQTLGLALHELATNAAKYGAFHAPGGRLSVKWTITDEALEFVWREHVPRLRRRAESRGFGTEVIERMLAGSLGAQINRTLHRDGLECRFVIPLDRLDPESSDKEA